MTDFEQSKMIISGAVVASDLPDDAPEQGESGPELELRQVTVPVESHGSRLDRALAGVVPEFSRNYLQQLIEVGAVRLDGQTVTKTSTKVKAMALDIVFEDAYLRVINKPAGLVVHPAPGHWSGTLLNGLLAYDPQAAYLPRAGVVHRLDKDTSGLMVVARERQAMDRLVDLIAARNVTREYIALAHGAWQGARTRRVDAAIGRDPRNRLRMAVVDLEKNSGKVASTEVTMLQSVERYCLVQCKLHTGRTHQIRVHMAFLGHPLVSDALYGGSAAGGLDRQALHAYRLAFVHPVTGAKMEFKSQPPADLQATIASLGLIYNHNS